ncbi:MAG: hypothetical protein ABEH78_06405 [Haloferacaceae archaeon]
MRVDGTALWAVSGLLLVVMVVAVALPVRPMVWIFPLWGAVVAAAMLAGVAAGAVAALRGWPHGGEPV